MAERKPLDDTLMDHAFRSQVYLERLKSGLVTRLEVMLQQTDRAIRDRLAAGLGDRAALVSALGDIDSRLEQIYATSRQAINGELRDIADGVAEYETAFLNSLPTASTAPAGVAVAQFVRPAIGQLEAAYKAAPLAAQGVGNAAGGALLDSALKDMTDYQKNSIIGLIRQGYSQGQSMDDMIRALRGTKANGFRDGLLAVNRRHAEAIVRTATQHVAETVKAEVYAANDDLIIGYQWVSTLDNRTSLQCRSLDGKKFRNTDKIKPKPPAHINCRSTTVPWLSEEFDFLDEGATRAARGESGKTSSVDADLTYYEWLKRQPADFQREVLGETRHKLFSKGGMNAKEFGRLNLNRAFQPLTVYGRKDDEGNLIEEGLIHKMPQAFRKAGLL